MEIDIGSLCSPGPALHALTLLHRWVIRTFMTIRTPIRTERTSNMMVPGVKRDPAIIYRDQTQTLVSAVAPTSIKFLESVLETEVTPISFPSQKSFPPGAISGKISRVFELIVSRLLIGPLQKSSPLIDWKWFMKFKQSFFQDGTWPLSSHVTEVYSLDWLPMILEGERRVFSQFLNLWLVVYNPSRDLIDQYWL